MKFVIGGIWIIICAGLLLAMLSGRVRLRSCCGATDANCDLRLKDAERDREGAFAPGPAPAPSGEPARSHW